ncbi:glutamate receptor ionotropic, delta-1-like [Cherax quadricarinatus]|uniref:glutamate receptor ionotropic, delta-1-like n=1 Tax=Cherax quadricarinatus TaxID=27406 RepID=UPI00387ED32A
MLFLLSFISQLIMNASVFMIKLRRKISCRIYLLKSVFLLVGWWLVFCLIITTGYSSSLIAHITVQRKTRPIETMEDLAKQDNWKWGTEPWLLKGVPAEYFSKHPDPIIQHIYKNMEMVSREEALRKILEGHYTLIVWENNLIITIASYYTDSHGNTPYFISKKGVSIMAAFGWGFRRGAPFYSRFHQLMSRLEDAGIIKYWTEDVIARRVRENRAAAALSPQVVLENTHMGDSKEIVLGMQHMQGAFYLLFLGCFLAILILLWENLAHAFFSP